jgi:hypothetical protein
MNKMSSVHNQDQKDIDLQLKIMTLSKIFIDHGGDLKRISSSIGISFKEDTVIKDPRDFAIKFLERSIQKNSN